MFSLTTSFAAPEADGSWAKWNQLAIVLPADFRPSPTVFDDV